MDTFQQIIETSSQIGYIEKFCSLVNTYQNLAKCTHSQCAVKSFNDQLKKVVVDSDSYENVRNSFLRKCEKNIEIFSSFYKLYCNENVEEVASFVPLICVEKYNLEKCICKVLLYIWE